MLLLDLTTVTLQIPVLHLDVFTLQGPWLHLDLSALQSPVQHQEVSTLQWSELHLGLVYTSVAEYLLHPQNVQLLYVQIQYV